MTRYTDLSFCFWSLFYILTPLFLSIMTSGSFIFIYCYGLSLAQWSEIGQLIGGTVGTLAAIISVFFIFRSFAEMRKQTEELKEQTEVMNKASIIESINKYLNDVKGNSIIETHRMKVAKSITKELTEEIMTSDKYAKYDKPKLIVAFQSNGNIHWNLENNSTELYFNVENEVPIEQLSFVQRGVEILPVIAPNSWFKYHFRVPFENFEDFTIEIHMVSSFTKRRWSQIIRRKDGKIFTDDPIELK